MKSLFHNEGGMTFHLKYSRPPPAAPKAKQSM